MIKLFATIRSSSKYFNQQPRTAAGEPLPFRIEGIEWRDFTHPLRGGPGGAYAFCDVDLYAQNEKGEYAKLSLHELNFRPQGFNPGLEDGTSDQSVTVVSVEKETHNGVKGT